MKKHNRECQLQKLESGMILDFKSLLECILRVINKAAVTLRDLDE